MLTISRNLKTVALVASLAVVFTEAHAVPTPPAPVTTYSGFSSDSSNAGTTSGAAGTPYQQTYSWNSYGSAITGDVHRLDYTTPGVVTTWRDVTTTNTTTTAYEYKDVAQFSVTGNSDNFNSNQWLKITGTVTPTKTGMYSFDFFTLGNYQPVSTPFGQQAPAMPSLYFALGTDPFNQLGSTTYSYPNGAYQLYGSQSSSFNAGQATSFSALIYSAGKASFSDFSLTVKSDFYGSNSLSHSTSNTVSTFVSAAPVPEPEPYVMFFAGLCLMAGVTRHRNR